MKDLPNNDIDSDLKQCKSILQSILKRLKSNRTLEKVIKMQEDIQDIEWHLSAIEKKLNNMHK